MSDYFTALDLLSRALTVLDDLGEGVAAAHLSGVIDLVEARIASESQARH